MLPPASDESFNQRRAFLHHCPGSKQDLKSLAALSLAFSSWCCYLDLGLGQYDLDDLQALVWGPVSILRVKFPWEGTETSRKSFSTLRGS